MTPLFLRCHERLIMLEGGWSHHKNDTGGRTMWGITESVARAYGYTGEMRELPLETAKQIACEAYWRRLSLDAVGNISEKIAEELFDTGYNCGVGIAAMFLQRALNAFNKQGAQYREVYVDGNIGAITVDALEAYIKARGFEGEWVMMKALNCLQGARYIALAEQRAANEDFVYGWINQRVGL
jgi:lysozyme family protein